MNIALITSTTDPASTNIREKLLSLHEFKETSDKFENNPIYEKTTKDKKAKLYVVNKPLIHVEDLDKEIEADVFIFISVHRADGGRPSLTVHPIGNFSEANYGGQDKKLCQSPSSLLKDIFVELTKVVEETKYEATLEATHHGPHNSKPTLFLELGSNEEFWKDEEGGKLVAEALTTALDKKSEEYETTVVLGGGHYGHVPNKTMLRSEIAVGHICPKHNFKDLDKEMLLQMVESTIPKPKFVLLDWKGLGKEKSKILELLKDNKIEYKRSDQYFKQT